MRDPAHGTIPNSGAGGQRRDEEAASLRADAASRGGTVAGVQILGIPYNYGRGTLTYTSCVLLK